MSGIETFRDAARRIFPVLLFCLLLAACSKKQDSSEDVGFPESRRKLGLPVKAEEPAKTEAVATPRTNAPPMAAVPKTTNAAPKSAGSEVAKLESEYPDELSWVVGEILNDIVEMCWYAKTGSLEGLKRPAVKLEHEKNPSQLAFKDPCVEKVTVDFGGDTIGPISMTIEGVWTPKSYAVFARSVLEKCGPTPLPAGRSRKYFPSKMREVLSARSRKRPRRAKCQASPRDMVASSTPTISWLVRLMV